MVQVIRGHKAPVITQEYCKDEIVAVQIKELLINVVPLLISCQLRNLAFKKIPPKSCAPPPCMTLSGIASELLSPVLRDPSIPSDDWQQWKQRDEQVRRQVRVQIHLYPDSRCDKSM